MQTTQPAAPDPLLSLSRTDLSRRRHHTLFTSALLLLARNEMMFDLLLPTLTLGGELLQVAMDLEKISCGLNSNSVAFKRWLDGQWALFPLLSRLVPIVKRFALIVCCCCARAETFDA